MRIYDDVIAVLWLLPLVLFAIYFSRSTHREERLMLAQFPAQYAQ